MSLSVQRARPVQTVVSCEQSAPVLSVIVPVTEQCGDLVNLYEIYAEVLRKIGRTFEFIVIFDGGSDRAADSLETLQKSGEPIRVFTLPRSFGEATALSVGFGQARGELVLILPPRFQVLPEGIHEILARLDEGNDLVMTRRYPRFDSWFNRLQDGAFNFLTCWLSGGQFHDMGSRLKGMRRRVAQEIDIYGDLHRFFGLLAYQRGFRTAEVSIPQHPLDAYTKFSGPGVYLRRLLDVLTVAFLFKFTKKPLRFFGLIGSALFITGFIPVANLVLQRIMGMTALADRPLLLLGIVLMVLGVQVASIGLLGEIIVFTHARKMRDYAVQRFLK